MKLWDVRNERKEKRGKEMKNQTVLERKLKKEMGQEEWWLVCGTLEIRPYNTRKYKAVMASKETHTEVVDQSREIVESEPELNEEIQRLKQQMSEMCQAWANGQGPPLSYAFPEFTPILATTTPVSLSDQFYPFRFSLHPNCMTIAGTSVAHSQTKEDHSPEYHSYLFDLPAKIEKPGRKIALKEITQRLKSLEQQLKNMQGLAGQKSISFKDLYMFPDVRLPLGFKTPKFEKYDGHGDPIACLKRYCNQLRGAGGNEELLMAYFGESLMGIASEWFMGQDTSCWYVWDDMAQAFVKQFQYNIDISTDRNSLSNLKKKPTESFREYAIKWREQATRVKPPTDDHEIITIFLQAQEPDYFQNMISAVGKSFSEAIKMGEMVENGPKTGKIISQKTLKAATQAVQIESGNFNGTGEKAEEIMMTSRSRRGPRRTCRRHDQPRLFFDDSPENQQYFVAPPQYVVKPPGYPRRRALAPQNLYQPPQIFQMHGNMEYENPPGNLLTEVNDIKTGECPSNFDVQSSG
ncbi:uncharacterized protein [Nicotiana sylvestris]|uniref:uncharacterized protein n=1 Tax=Nicotiana sylvestris TaxID=4096 RepID=UPI00388C67F3